MMDLIVIGYLAPGAVCATMFWSGSREDAETDGSLWGFCERVLLTVFTGVAWPWILYMYLRAK